MCAVQRIGDSQNAGQFPHNHLVFRIESRKFLMLGFRLALTVVARDLSDDLNLTTIEAGEVFGIADDVVGMQVMLCVGNEESDVVQNAGRLQVFAIDVVELVEAAQLVKKLEGEFRDLVRMIFFVVGSFRRDAARLYSGCPLVGGGCCPGIFAERPG